MAAICGNVASNQQLIGTLMGSLRPPVWPITWGYEAE